MNELIFEFGLDKLGERGFLQHRNFFKMGLNSADNGENDMKKSWINGFTAAAIIAVITLPCPAFAKAEQISRGIFEADGYRFDVSARQKDGAIRLRGRVSYGEPCDALSVTFHLRNEAGKAKKMTVVIENAGGAKSPTIRAEQSLGKKKNIKSEEIDWEIEDIRTRCKD